MSNMTAAQAHKANLHAILSSPQTAYRNELLDWKTSREQAIINRLKAMFTVDFPFPPLTTKQLDTIRAVLRPEGIINPPEPSDDSILTYMSLAQEQLAAELRCGHRLFCGVAGSGKTIILLARAKHLANRLGNQRILIVCFNITLAAYLRSTLYEDRKNPQYREQILVLHFHDWAKSILGRLPNPKQIEGDYSNPKSIVRI